ncbi:MAG TPA: DUF4340 domain-containing protein [bacterium]|nr:DUF4340 domain-containing protein [bacterium]
MKPKQTMILLAVVAAVIAGIAAYQYVLVPREKAKHQEEALLFPGFDPAKAAGIEIKRGDTVSALSRPASGDTAWVVVSQGNYPADPEAVKNALDMLKGLKETTPASEEKQSFERLGVDEKGLRVTVKAGESVIADLIVGKQGSSWGTNFVRKPDADNTCLVYENLAGAFDKKGTGWRDKKIFAANADDITGIKLTKTTGPAAGTTAQPVTETMVLSKDKATGDWGLVTHGDSVEPLDQDKVAAVARNLAALSVAEFEKLSPADAGLDNPAMKAEFTMTSGKTYTLLAGKKQESKYYVKRPDRDAVMSVYQYNVTNIFKDADALKPLPGGAAPPPEFDMSNMLPAPPLGQPGPGGMPAPAEGLTP